MLEIIFKWEIEKQGPEAAYALVRDELKRNPTMLGLEKLLEAAIHTVDAERKGDVELVKGLIHGHTRRVARYACKDCGFKARQFYWCCPALRWLGDVPAQAHLKNLTWLFERLVFELNIYGLSDR
ncbi:MAG: hypothetical protein U5N85_07010 [Arcicella sp.]|nr:hypothetical protein [Arcicella sp.]